jgi:hypothetical protein
MSLTYTINAPSPSAPPLIETDIPIVSATRIEPPVSATVQSAPSLIEADIPIVPATPIDSSVVSVTTPVISNAQPTSLDISNQQDQQIAASDFVQIVIPFCLQSQTTVPALVEK